MAEIIWRNEVLAGAPAYDIVAAGGLVLGARLELCNAVLKGGTPHDAQSMESLVQKQNLARSFYYDGSEVPLYNDLVVLAKGRAGNKLHASGPVYLVYKSKLQRLDSLKEVVLEHDCEIHCEPGLPVSGAVFSAK